MRYETQQWIAKPLAEVWPFFCDETNLERLTPPWLKFRVVSKSTQRLQEGTVINYALRLHGLPIRWQSRIENWQPPFQFVDTQIKGPYAVWHHTHQFEDHGSRTLALDIIRFELPFGFLGRLLNPWVRRDVERIFTYRQTALREIFDTPGVAAAPAG